jgi:2,4-dienoyl-CoA reductase-like NADH-dependent reductase (Old Yellow Enzyme family)
MGFRARKPHHPRADGQDEIGKDERRERIWVPGRLVDFVVQPYLLPAHHQSSRGLAMPSLFDPIKLGAIDAPNRVLMAPLTRGRATRDHVPTSLMTRYYAQRASAGLIITEATGISLEGLGWPYAPGLWNAQQVEAWKPVVDAVHEHGGRIMAQLWHMGRLVHPAMGGVQPISASAICAPGSAHTYEGKPDNVMPRAASRDDIARVLDDYARAAANAMSAGFDGVQLHAANGYLVDQFLRDGTNKRDDDYGGPPENRVRLLVEATSRLIDAAGAGRTSVRLSPNGEIQGVDDSDPERIFTVAADALQTLGIAFLELREAGPHSDWRASSVAPVSPAIRKVFAGPLVLNQDYDAESAAAALGSGVADAITFGRPFLANPDLPERLRQGAQLNAPDKSTFYSRAGEGYVDYPFLAAQAAEPARRVRRSYMAWAARAASPPLSLSSGRARESAWSSFSTVRIPFPTATPFRDRVMSPRALSEATISKW